MRTFLILVLSFCFLQLATAQDFPYGQISTDELNMKNYASDISAHAVVLREYGKAQIQVASDDNIKVMFEYHVKIKIFDKKGFDEATTEIKLRNNDDHSDMDEIEKVTGATYFTGDDGTIHKVEFDPKKVYTTRDYKYQSTFKFTMPALVEGCVVEYTYRLFSPIGLHLDNFHPWEFQSDIPKVYSEFEAIIPGHFTYNAALRGYLKLTKNTSSVLKGCFSTHGAASDCSDIIYAMSDIPAFIEEDDMTSPKNYLSTLSFDLVEFTNPYNGVVTKETKEWKDIDYSLKSDYAFGGQLKRKDLLKDRILPAYAGKTDDLEKAKAIYAYLQKWFKWNDYIGYESDGIKKAFESHTGSIADINMALITALNGAGINTEAVLLSTRENGLLNDLYPAVNKFNYIIAKANIGDKIYLLDASDPLMAFGMLPLKCLNDKGRVFSLDKPSYWIDLNLPQKETSNSVMEFTLQDDGKIKGTITNYSMGYEAYKKRVAIKKFNTTDEYVEDIAGKFPKLKILKSEISNLDSLDKPVMEKYEVEINIYDKMAAGSLTFNPFFLDRMTTNPYKLTERSYPVDRGMPGDYRTTLIMHLPAQYVVDNPPKALGIALPNNGGRFLTDFQASDDNTFTFSHIIQLNKSIYSSQEYPYLKELYNNIIQSEKAEMVFKKK
ncbi:DUF3857 domain-containing protein [Mucilaginibacter sp.]|uniref:DUF3857 domain-containing protein n=1 Tax=Mucilaginibacter sp. TaxID=1882438 RepID=UPI00284F94AC|nr:DUF3857 domain-containing protein [Mucilaginibacter sp.]MDR3696071.1 DUF3857 domain-containing protein [Mucilaginibacter sp.]